MENNYSPSINILRDSTRNIHYIPTPNARGVVNQIVNDFKKGTRSFNIIGTYGTGKSSFLVAFENSIQGVKRYFEPNFVANSSVDFIKVVGSYNSIIEVFSTYFDIATAKNKNEEILSEIFNRYYSIDGKEKLLFLLVDEFGKFLEYASKYNPENELYFIQQLAEFCNNPKYNIVLITTVHQSFESYAYSLSPSQKQEWTKVKGRFREITFNEPVEQLLYLASEYLSSDNSRKEKKEVIEECLKLTNKTKAFSINNDFLSEIADKLFPLDILSASILTFALQRYGQNERSLFSFLESTDYSGISKFDKQDNPFYNLSCVYDYLNFNFYSFLTSRYNPDFSSWSSLRSALEEAERAFESGVHQYAKAIKVIGLLNIFAAHGSILDLNFLNKYLQIACGVSNGNEIIRELEAKKIIRYRSHSKCYILFEGTDLDIQTALIEAGNKISEVSDVTTLLNKYFTFTPVFAKLYSYETGTPRFFEFIITEHPIDRIPTGEIDGYVNLIFNSKIDSAEVQHASEAQKEAIVYCFFKNSSEIKSLLFEIEKIQKVIEENGDDKVAKRELESIINSQTRLLNHYIVDSIYSSNDAITWFFKGSVKKISNKKDFNKLLSQVCSIVYNATPVFKNELVNKHRLSGSIHTAKRNYFKALANNWHIENLDFADTKFPPEKTIYLSLLKENGISPIRDNSYDIPSINENSTFIELWKVSENFISSAKSEKKRISELADILKQRPFKLKQGFIDFWVPSYLFIKRDDFALFNDQGYIPSLTDENLELIAKYPEDYTIKAFDIEGVKMDIFNGYRTFLNQSTSQGFNNNSFRETIKPFLTFYKQLPEYSKKTKRLSPAAIRIRSAIATSKDPEETFFDAFPNAIGISLESLQSDKSQLQDYTIKLQNAVRELRTSFDGLIERIEKFICSEIIGKEAEFEDYKSILQKRYSKLKKHLLLAKQKNLIQRIDSALEDRQSWLSSIAQVVSDKQLESFSDEDEVIFEENFKSLILDLDSLTNISRADIDEKHEDVIAVKIDSFFTKIDPKIVRVPRSKSEAIEKIKIELRAKLGSDSTSNIAAVLNLLKELLQ